MKTRSAHGSLCRVIRNATYIEDNLVEELQGIATEHQGYDVPIDPPAEGFDVNS